MSLKNNTPLAGKTEIYKSLIEAKAFLEAVFADKTVKDFEDAASTIFVSVNASVTRASIVGMFKSAGKDEEVLAREVAKFVIMCSKNTNMAKLYGNAVCKTVIDEFNVQAERGVRITGKRLWGNVLSAFPEFCCARAALTTPNKFKPAQGGEEKTFGGDLPLFLCHHAAMVMGLDVWDDEMKDIYVRSVMMYNNWYVRVRLEVTPAEKRAKITPEQVQAQRIRTIQAAKSVFTHFPDPEKAKVWENIGMFQNMTIAELKKTFDKVETYDPIADKSGNAAKGHNFYVNPKAVL
jgi:hypothetical protein